MTEIVIGLHSLCYGEIVKADNEENLFICKSCGCKFKLVAEQN